MLEPDEQRAMLERMQQAVGECILTWAKIENSLAFMFAGKCGIPFRAAVHVLSVTRNFDHKIKMIDYQIVRQNMLEDRRNAWPVIQKKLRGASHSRARIAHATAATNGEAYSLRPYFKWVDDIENEMSEGDVRALTTHFIEILETLEWFSAGLQCSDEARLLVSEMPRPRLLATT